MLWGIIGLPACFGSMQRLCGMWIVQLGLLGTVNGVEWQLDVKFLACIP